MCYCCHFLIPTAMRRVVLASTSASKRCCLLSAVEKCLFWHTSINRCDSLRGGLAARNVPGIAQKRDFLPAVSVSLQCLSLFSARGLGRRSSRGEQAPCHGSSWRRQPPAGSQEAKDAWKAFVWGHAPSWWLLVSWSVQHVRLGWGHVPSLIYP